MARSNAVNNNWTSDWPLAYLISVAFGGVAFTAADLGLIYLEGAASAFPWSERVQQYLIETAIFIIPTVIALELLCLVPAVLIARVLRSLRSPFILASLATGTLVGCLAGYSWVIVYAHYFDMSAERTKFVLIFMTMGGSLAGWLFAMIMRMRNRSRTVN